MPSVTIPLFGGATTRKQTWVGDYTAATGTDQHFTNGIFDIEKNPVTGSATVYVKKRPGFTPLYTVSSGNGCLGAFFAPGRSTSNLIGTWLVSGDISVTSDTSGTVIGTISSSSQLSGKIFEVIQNNESNIIIPSSGAGIFYHAFNATGTGFSGTTSSGSAVVTGIASTTNLRKGQGLSGTGIAAAARILSIDSSSQITMTDNATASGTVTITPTKLAKILTDNSPTWSGIPTTTGDLVYMDGYLFAAEYATGRLYNSDLNDLASFSASSYLTANISSDKNVTLARYKNQIVLFGSRSIEFFYNAGNASGSPLSPSEQLYSNIGASCAATIDDNVYFFGSTTHGERSFYKFDGFSPRKIANPFSRKYAAVLANSEGPEYLTGISVDGKNLVLASYANPGSGYDSLSVVYDPEMDVWTPWESQTSMRALRYPAFYTTTGPGTLIGGSDGKFYYSGQSSDTNPIYADSPTAHTLTIQTSKLNYGTEKIKYHDRVSLIGADKQSSGTATLEFSDDDYATWTTAGTFDMTRTNPFVPRCGSHRGGRAWRITHSANTPFRAQALKFDYREGTS